MPSSPSASKPRPMPKDKPLRTELWSYKAMPLTDAQESLRWMLAEAKDNQPDDTELEIRVSMNVSVKYWRKKAKAVKP